MAKASTGGVLSKLSLPAKMVFGLILMGVIAALYFIVFFADIDGQINKAHAKEEELKGELQKAEDARVAYQKDVDEKTKMAANELERKKILPDEAETPSFLASLQNVATVSGVGLTQYRPEDEVSEDYFVRVPMSIALQGRFHQIARFFFGVSRLDRVINIEDIEIKLHKSTKEGEETTLEVKCLATAFRAKKAAESTGEKKKAKK
ncbi:MAG: type 4a pilus biogenesis protein PilO [Polyangiaceae bacterium]